MRDVWSKAPFVELWLPPPPPPPSCPFCQSTSHAIVKTIDNGDGSRMRRCVCNRCSERFIIVVETIASVGNADDLTL